MFSVCFRARAEAGAGGGEAPNRSAERLHGTTTRRGIRFDEWRDRVVRARRTRDGRETDERDRVVCVSVCARGIERVTDP